jgi:phosphatidylglycerol:prolipoprotein diacylglycerol transferase
MQPRQLYGLFMFLAAAVFVLARYYQPRSNSAPRLPWWQQIALALAAFVGGTLGAKATFALADPQAWQSLRDWMIVWSSDGKTITVGLASAYLAVEFTKLALGIHVKTGDGFALPLALAMTVGRLGCFFNGCCFGTETTLPWGVAFPIDDYATRRHPTQLYECLFHLGMAGILYGLIRRDLLRFQRLKFYLISYCVYRFMTEFIRPEPIWWLGLTFYQWVSVALAGGLTIQWYVDRECDYTCGGNSPSHASSSRSSTRKGSLM